MITLLRTVASRTDDAVRHTFQDEQGSLFEATFFTSDSGSRCYCISSQSGCAIGCRFCLTGLMESCQNLSWQSMVGQLEHLFAAAMPPDRLDAVVFMGMGEPLCNEKNVTRAIGAIGERWGHLRIDLSTVGLIAGVERLVRMHPKVNISISLHAATDVLRHELIPRAPSRVADLMRFADRYHQNTGRTITFTYMLVAGINDQPIHIGSLIELCRNHKVRVRLTRLNVDSRLKLARPTIAHAQNVLRDLRDAGIPCHYREGRGQEVGAACGQLAVMAAVGSVQARS